MPTILHVDDTDGLPRTLESEPGIELLSARGADEARVMLDEQCVDLLVVDAAIWRQEALHDIVERLETVPVVVITGDDDTRQGTVAMLRLGAASFVPRSALERDLPATIENLLELTDKTASWDRVAECLERSECDLRLTNDLELITPVVRYLQSLVKDFGFCDRRTLMGIGIALREALSNAIIHGNLEVSSSLVASEGRRRYYEEIRRRAASPPYVDRHVQLEVAISASAASFLVRDEGPGFDVDAVPDPTAPEKLESLGGRGVLLMRSYMDLVSWSRGGREVTLVKRSDRQDRR